MSNFRPQLAVACKDTTKLNFPLISEPKIDGVRCVCVIKDGRPTFWSRDGKPFVNFEELENIIIHLLKINTYPSIHLMRNCILDGEILATSGNFDDTISRTRSHRGVNTHIDYNYHIFDILINPEPLGTIYPLIHRKDYLNHVFGTSGYNKLKIVEWNVVENIETLLHIHTTYCSLGYEGTMVKPLNSLYHQGRNQDWKKIKPFFSADLTITGITMGKGKAANMMGRIMVEGPVDDSDLNRVVKCEVGTGFSDELRKEMWENREKYIGQVVEIQYQEVTKDNSLRFPSFKRFRKDKTNV